MAHVEVNWRNIVVLGLFVVAVVILMTFYGNIKGFLRGIGHMGPNHPIDEQMWGLAAFGLLAILLAGIIKILTQNKN